MYHRDLYRIILLPLCCYALPLIPFSESEKAALIDIHTIPDYLIMRLWENYNNISDTYYPGHIHNNIVHKGYKVLLSNWNRTFYDYYWTHKKVPRVPDDAKPPYFVVKVYNDSLPFYENLDVFLTTFFFEKYHIRNGFDIFIISDYAEALWVAALLQRRAMLHTFHNKTMEKYKKKQIYGIVKRMTLFFYPTHREADKAFDYESKPRVNNFPEILAPDMDIYLPAQDFLEVYENNYTNICPITENYICNTMFPLYQTEGLPCYCAIIEPLEVHPVYSSEECLRDADFYSHQFMSITISSFIPNNLAPSNTYGLLFGELLAIAIANATMLPGYFKSEVLSTNPVVIFRLHCSDLMQEFTIQFALTTRKITTAPDGAYEQDYLFLSPKRFWEEVDDQMVLQYVEDMGIQVLRYGIVDNLTNVEEPNTESPFEYPMKHEEIEGCRLPQTDSEFLIFHFVVFENNCPHLYLAFWKTLLLTWILTFGFLCIMFAGFATCFQRYRWIISFGRLKRWLKTEYVD